MKKYDELYNTIKNMIIKGELQSGEKVLSIRKAAELYNVSITTVQNAYFELCANGYLIAVDKSGYYVSELNKNSDNIDYNINEEKFIYDLTGIADESSFDFTLWQRYIKSALRQTQRLASYSEPSGEKDLRIAISQYVKDRRNIIASPERIVVGAGVGSLLNILASLLNDATIVSFPDESFKQGIGIFNDYGYNVKTRYKDADIVYVSPSHMTRWGDVMPTKRRIELVNYSVKNNSIVIEDDYENEFLYNVRPTPSLYTLGKGNIIYIGSFSQMLLPGIRISFMILTDELIDKFNLKKEKYAQTASKTEQIALASYIRDGHLSYRIRKIRRLYTTKTKIFSQKLVEKFPEAHIEIGENQLQILFKCKCNKDVSSLKKSNINMYIQDYNNNILTLVISPSGINTKEIDDCIDLLKKSIV